MKKVHIVSHTHWDREWYFSTSDSLVLLDHVVTDVLRVLTNNRNLNICLDGQTSILEDYLKINPQKIDVIKQLISNGQLSIGPWYTQTDTFYVAGESIVNNLYYGIYQSMQLFGQYMSIAYLPDTFGFSNQLPMIASGFNIKNCIIWRGVDFEQDQMEPYFRWQSLGSDQVRTAVLHGGYGGFKKANASEVFINEKLNPLINEISELTTQAHVLMPVGNDQHNISHELDKIALAYGENYKISTYETFFDVFNDKVAPCFSGEFRHVKYTRVHRSSGGVRVDIKQSNYKAEQQLTRVTQPLLAISHELGLPVSTEVAWLAWKKLFEGQAHDGIVGCVSDDVALDILNRNKQAYELAKSQENLIKKMIGQKVRLKKDEVMIFNTSLSQYNQYQTIDIITHDEYIKICDVIDSEIVESKLIKGYTHALVEKPEGNHYERELDYYIHKVIVKADLKPLSYQVFKFRPLQEKLMTENEDHFIKNDDFHFYVENNRLSLKTNQSVFHDFIHFLDRANAGDTYDFSPLKEVPTNISFDITHINCKKVSHYQEMKLTYKAILPSTIENRIKNQLDVAFEIDVLIKLVGDEYPKISVDFNNNILNHQLRVGFKTTSNAKNSIASTPFGHVTRPIVHADDLLGWETKNLEIPIDIHPNSGVVGVDCQGANLWVFNKGVKEYQVIDDYIYMTLFSATDELGKPNLLYRPGRASGDTTKKGHIRIKTPLAQVLGNHKYEFAIGEFECIKEALVAFETFERIPVFYQNQTINLFYERIDNKIDLIDYDETIERERYFNNGFSDEFITSIYISKYDNQPVIRLYSLENVAITETMKQEYVIGNLLEEKIETDYFERYKLYTLRSVKDEFYKNNY